MVEQIIVRVLLKLADPLVGEFCFLHGVKNQLEFVRIELRMIQDFLKDAASKQKGDSKVNGWVREVTDVAFEIDDAIDKYIFKIHNINGKHVPLWKRCALKPAELIAWHKLGTKISKIRTKIEIISRTKTALGINNLGEGGDEARLPLQNPVVPDIDNNQFVGFEVEKERILSALINGAGTSNQKNYIISIVGPGGLGKTTLAKKIYNSLEVKKRFDNCVVWLTISKDFKPTDVLKKLYEEVTDHNQDNVEEPDVYLSRLNHCLREKKYMIVLDDVWTDDVFEFLKVGLPDVGLGSRVIITTRSLHVAKLADFSNIFKLPFLSEDESLELLLQNALQISHRALLNCPGELMGIAKELANRCDGLPLAIVVLGRQLFKQPQTQASWSRVERNLDWCRDMDRNCMNILATSYDDLPYYLKSCFRYLACFPEDDAINAKRLLMMWIAEGFTDQNENQNENGTLEDKTERWLEELAERSLVQVIKRKWNDSIATFQVHDLLSDLAMHEAKKYDYLLTFSNQSTQTDFNKARRIVVHYHNNIILENKKLVMPNVRFFLNFDEEFPVEIAYPLLRVLELQGSKNLTKLPKEFKRMIHLRYLGLANTNLEQLPKIIGCLQNLQTLNVCRTRVMQLPSSLWKIQSLRHVMCDKLTGPPPSTNLLNLQTLDGICVPKSWENGLPYLPNLRHLEITNFDMEDNENASMPNWFMPPWIIPRWNMVKTLLGNLEKLLTLSIEGTNFREDFVDVTTSPSYQHLQTLTLCGCDNNSKPPNSDYPPPYSGLLSLHTIEMPQNLIMLKLLYIIFDEDPTPKLEKLPCLKSLTMAKIQNVEEMICSAGGFSQLQYLHISTWYDLRHWKVEEKSMPLLKELVLQKCHILEELPDLRHVKTLQKFGMCLLNSTQVKFKNRTGEEWQKIQHIPTIKTL